MLRALAKGAALLAFGRAPGGPALYRALTREHLGTYATHVDKLSRVWPGYLAQWTARAGLSLDGARLWVHAGGETPFASLAAYLLTGSAGVVTNVEGGLLDRYLARAVDGVLSTAFPEGPAMAERRARLEALRWEHSAEHAVHSLGGRVDTHVDVARLPLPTGSVDLCHSGGELEHLEPRALDFFLAESRRVLRAGGLASHVVDHRDHLHHADRGLPFLAHLALPGAAYKALSGHALGYHNRLSPTQVAARFEAAGFERICVRRMRYPERAYVEGDAILTGDAGLERTRLARRFREISEHDLRTAAAHYLYRKR